MDSATVDGRINGGAALNVSQESVQEFQLSTFNFDLSAGLTGTAPSISSRGEAATSCTAGHSCTTAITISPRTQDFGEIRKTQTPFSLAGSPGSTLAHAKNNKEIAAGLSLTVNAVDIHRAAIMHKLKINSLFDLVHYAMRKGLVENKSTVKPIVDAR